jgi:hypothetical protein
MDFGQVVFLPFSSALRFTKSWLSAIRSFQIKADRLEATH